MSNKSTLSYKSFLFTNSCVRIRTAVISFFFILQIPSLPLCTPCCNFSIVLLCTQSGGAQVAGHWCRADIGVEGGGFIDGEIFFEMSRRSFEKSRVLTERSPSPQDETVAGVSSNSAERRKTAGGRFIFPNILHAQNAPNPHFYFHDRPQSIEKI